MKIIHARTNGSRLNIVNRIISRANDDIYVNKNIIIIISFEQKPNASIRTADTRRNIVEKRVWREAKNSECFSYEKVAILFQTPNIFGTHL